MAVRQSLGDQDGIAKTYLNLGNVALQQGGYQEARAHLQESLALWRSLDARTGLTDALTSYALALFLDGEDRQARAEAWEALRLARATGRAGMAWNVLGLLGVSELKAGRHATAVRLAGAAIEQVEALGGAD